MNSVNLIGRLTKDPETRHTQSGMAVCRFTLAIDRGLSKDKKADAESKGQPTADFISIIAFGKTAELITNYITKGQQLGITGRIQTSSYDNQDGNRVFRTDVIADRIHFIASGGNNKKQNNSNYNQKSKQYPEEDFGLGGDAFPLQDDDIPF